MKSGIDPVVVGLVMGLATFASPAARVDLERATDLFRLFREQPTPELARSATIGLQAAISPNERLQQLYHPWTSYVIVPLFALANAGIPINGASSRDAYTSPVTLGILFGYVAGQADRHRRRLGARHEAEPRPAAAAGRLGGGRGRRPHRRDRLHGLAPDREPRLPRRRSSHEAKLGLLSAAVCASVATWLLFRAPRGCRRGSRSGRCSARPRC